MDHFSLMRVLIVEDTPERQDVLKQLYKEHAWVMVHTARRALTLMEAYRFDVISLDYDIADELTGADIADRVPELQPQARVIVHSMNPQGRSKIQEILPHAVILPVASMIKSNQRFKQLREELRKGVEFDWTFATNRHRGS
jgi:CheY-like chemotaxis protein